MRRVTRKTFERLVCGCALALPLVVLLAAGESEYSAYGQRAGGSVSLPSQAASKASSTQLVQAAASNPAAEAQAAGTFASLSYRTSWIGNTWGYGDGRWMQIDVQAIAVTPQGDVFTNAPWDESGGELGQYRNGELLRHGGETHGWGMMGGDAIAVNDEYVFVAQTMVSLGNETAKHRPSPREGEVWTGVSRRSRADIRDGVPFAGQVKFPAGSRLAFLLISSYSAKNDYAIRGLAADDTRLFVSNALDNRVQIVDAQTMQGVGAFPVREPGRLALAPDGSLWIIENTRTDAAQRVVHRARNGAVIGELQLPQGVVPVDLAVDARGRLFVADNGVRQQILIFSADTGASAGNSQQATAMKWTASLGQEGGIYSGRAGAAGPRRFNGLTGVGVDRAGNVYVSMNGAGPRAFGTGASTYDGALLESYMPDGRQRFSLQGLLFVDGAQFVDGNPPSVYSGSKRFTLDLSRASGEEWSYAGYTADRFRYPYDPYFHLYLGGQRGMPMVRDIDGHRLLYTTDMYSSYLRIYRFADDRETAIASGLFSQAHIDGAWPRNQPARGEWIWRDLTGVGDFSPASFDQNSTATDAPTLRAWWVDSRGDIWQGTEAAGIRVFPLQGFDRVGNPVYRYAAMRQYPAPAPFYRIARLNYFSDDDTLFVSGSTRARPFNQDNWNSAGSQLARYDHWKTGRPVLRYLIDLPDEGPPGWLSVNGFAVAGDYIFAVETRSAAVRVYERASGRDIGRLTPGREVGSTSGWADVPMPVTAQRLASGEYLVFVEEDARGKVLMYRFTPPTAALAAVSHPSTDVAGQP
ncbi:hypothetical protein [Paraburkholderia phenoliruptrix]|uniref:hypothetical protein n=1 Tax=Paraburkholderia phenoliruptrix TaxID=252970 RepID=UPI001C6E45A8|nr:hypothetical protein [Paraburkholderia phenoliruptrix]MBW9107100.1 hypothetical protein [Paraburkholderia phenoliruptrix]MBW9132068.1 hypothetical protein [Paraburkholderia ginsengiterrae]